MYILLRWMLVYTAAKLSLEPKLLRTILYSCTWVLPITSVSLIECWNSVARFQHPPSKAGPLNLHESRATQPEQETVRGDHESTD